MSVSFNRVLRSTNEADETLATQETVISEREYFVALNGFFYFFCKERGLPVQKREMIFGFTLAD